MQFEPDSNNCNVLSHNHLNEFFKARIEQIDPLNSKVQTIPAGDLTIEIHNGEASIMLAVRNISGTFGEEVQIEHLNTDLFYR